MSRPEYKPTAADRRRVEIAAGGGMSHEEIALALGISRPTLYKHFEFEISTGANKRRLSWLESMDKAARKGNVAAMKALLATTPALAAPPVPRDGEKQAAAPVEPLGKKGQAAADAVTAANGTSWETLLKPPTAHQ